ncbi:hypothetical protein ACFFLS_26060 [Flavobacterium procerum]|uniref:Lipoprotein n=1 Tax=Flavobacterium procerum TaxID=1455569 RepID=A0ABV6BYJ0_9FLAO
MKKIIVFVFLFSIISCSNTKNKMEINKIANVEIITGSKSKVDYFEVYNHESVSIKEAMQKIKAFYKTTLKNDAIQKYEEYRCCFYVHTSRVKYSSFAGNNTSNFEEGGIRDWDNPLFYNMDEYLFAMIYRDNKSANFVIYEDNKIVMDETENN